MMLCQPASRRDSTAIVFLAQLEQLLQLRKAFDQNFDICPMQRTRAVKRQIELWRLFRITAALHDARFSSASGDCFQLRQQIAALTHNKGSLERQIAPTAVHACAYLGRLNLSV